MQIHEITKLGKSRTDEGLLDNFKSAVGISTPENPIAPDSRTMWQKFKGDIPNAPDKSSPEYKEYEKQLKDKTERLEKSFTDKGYTIGSDLDKAISAVEQSPTAQSAIQGMTQQFDDQFQPGLPDPGFVFTMVRKVGGVDVTFTKDEKGVWKNQNGGIIAPQNATGLEQQLDAGGAKQIQAPSQAATTPVKGKQPQKVAESLLLEARKTLAQDALEQFVAPKIQDKDDAGQPITFNDVLQIPEVRNRLNKIFKGMMQANKSNPKNIRGIIDGFKNYMTVGTAGLQLVKKNRAEGVEPDQSEQEYGQKPNQGMATGYPLADKLSQEISPEGLDILEKDPEKGLKAIQDILNTKKRKRY